MGCVPQPGYITMLSSISTVPEGSAVRYNASMKLLVVVGVLLGIVLVGCGTTDPIATPLPTTDIKATVEAQVQATLAAMPVATPAPTATIPPTKLPPPPTPTPTPTPTHTPIPTPTHTPIPSPTPLPTPTPSPIPLPTPTPTPAATPTPTSTATPTPAPNLANVVDRVRPSVVLVRAGSSEGSGFIFDDDGWILTAAHVVEGQTQVTVVLGDRIEVTGRVVGKDDELDVAVIKIDLPGQVPPLPMGQSDSTKVGDEVLVMGYPLGIALGEHASATKGIISAKRVVEGQIILQIDAAVNPGNSGGPLVNDLGEAIGLIIAKIEAFGERAIEGIGFAIPITSVRAVLPFLKAGALSSPTPTAVPTPTRPSLPTVTPSPTSPSKPESTEGRPWGQPLKKPAGAPLNLG